MIVYLVRHGQSVGNVKLLCYGHCDYPLTDQGEKDAALAAEKLKDAPFGVCWTSALSRAVKTAEICVADRDVEVVSTPLLNEQFMGDFEDISFSDLLIRYPREAHAMLGDWSSNPPRNGESFDTLYDRVSAFADMMLTDGRDCLVVAHNGSLGALTARLLGLDKRKAMCFQFDHGYISRIRLTQRGAYLEKFNA